MRRITAGLLSIATMSALLVGCADKNTASGNVKKNTQSAMKILGTEATETYTATGELDKTLGQGVNHLAFSLATSQNEKDDNYFFSPYSISSALTVLDNAAGGETKVQLERVLGIQNLDAWNNQLALFRARQDGQDAYLTAADSLWIQSGYTLNPEADTLFFPVVRDGLGAEVLEADFRNACATVKEQISQWVSDKTNGMIANYKPLCTESTKVDILDAVYFQGKWQYFFMEDDTKDMNFYGTAKTKQVPMMLLNDVDLRYINTGSIRGLSIPYKGGRYVMNVLIPTNPDEDTIMDLFEALTENEKQELLDSLMNATREDISAVRLPKFSFDNSYQNLRDTLVGLGMESAFSQGADFDILSNDLYVDEIAHRAKIEVDEQGTRAAAVTEIVLTEGCAMEEIERISFIVNCPFLFFIQDTETGMIVFMGGIKNLEKEV